MTKTNVTSVAVHLKPRDIKYTCAQSIFDDPKALQMGYRKNEETIEIKRLYYMWNIEYFQQDMTDRQTDRQIHLFDQNIHN